MQLIKSSPEYKEIQDIIAKNPKSFAKIIKYKPELKSWIESNALNKSSWLKMIYSAVNQDTLICKYNKERNLASFHLGARNCGTAKVCQCTREQVSEKVIATKNKVTAEEQQLINDKRTETTLLKYGVANVGQTNIAKQKHKEFYDTIPKKEKVSSDLKLLGYTQFANYVKSTYNFELLTPFDAYYGIRQKDAHEYKFQCLKCLTAIDKKFYHSRGLRCENCNPMIVRKMKFLTF